MMRRETKERDEDGGMGGLGIMRLFHFTCVHANAC